MKENDSKFDISASVVIYKTPGNMIDKVIEAFLNSKSIASVRLFIIDNAPGDTVINKKLIEDYRVEYIKMELNLGYGAAHNVAMRLACKHSRYHVVLNPDILFDSDVLFKLKKFLDINNDITEVMPKVVYPDGELQRLCKLLPTPFDLFARRFIKLQSLINKSNERYELIKSGYDKIMDVPCLSGCFMFLRSSDIVKHKLYFDDRFFMYLEDFDLIRRCGRVGRTVYYPDATIVHDHQKMSYQSKKAMWIHVKSAIKYFNKYGWFFDSERRKINQEVINRLGI